MKSAFWIFGSGLLLSACGSGGSSDSAGPKQLVLSAPAVADWRNVVSNDDRRRLREWRTAFTTALDEARQQGFGSQIVQQGALLNPDAALQGATIPAGNYQCRVIKIGIQNKTKNSTLSSYTAYPSFTCKIANEGEVSSFTKLSGSQRPVGLIFKDDDKRQIFLGTMMLGDERRAIDYSHDSERDMAGVVERIGPNRWRMILPWPRFESLLDVVELVPAS